jgi:hypothetical protein
MSPEGMYESNYFNFHFAAGDADCKMYNGYNDITDSVVGLIRAQRSAAVSFMHHVIGWPTELHVRRSITSESESAHSVRKYAFRLSAYAATPCASIRN